MSFINFSDPVFIGICALVLVVIAAQLTQQKMNERARLKHEAEQIALDRLKTKRTTDFHRSHEFNVPSKYAGPLAAAAAQGEQAHGGAVAQGKLELWLERIRERRRLRSVRKEGLIGIGLTSKEMDVIAEKKRQADLYAEQQRKRAEKRGRAGRVSGSVRDDVRDSHRKTKPGGSAPEGNR